MENLYSVRSGAAHEVIARLGSLLKSSEQSLGDRPGIFVMVGFIIFPKCLCPDFWDMWLDNLQRMGKLHVELKSLFSWP